VGGGALLPRDLHAPTNTKQEEEVFVVSRSSGLPLLLLLREPRRAIQEWVRCALLAGPQEWWRRRVLRTAEGERERD
jgi:hypothetical protein